LRRAVARRHHAIEAEQDKQSAAQLGRQFRLDPDVAAPKRGYIDALEGRIHGFNAGEKLVFSIDVDEVQQFDPAETNINAINEGIDPIASGVEFQGSHLTADFQAPHFHDISGTSEFRNKYDPLFDGANLLVSQGNANGLPNDDFQSLRDRSTGTMLSLQQLPLPVTIAGRVFADNNRNLVQDGQDVGLNGVSLALDETKHIRLAGLRGKIVHLVIKQKSGAFHGYRRAVTVVYRIGV
jgi:hypothetical protein